MKDIYRKLIEGIPDYKEFLTLEELDRSSVELANRYKDAVELFVIGHTRTGYPIQCLRIGEGDSNALMFGCPHPNEPIGTMMIEYFAEALASDKELREELGYTWYIVKVWDADGYRLNEGWLKGPYTISNYAKEFYRPPAHLQVEWTFPIDYKDYHFHNTLPETVAMRRLIADIKPRFTYSLHNSGFGGAYWYMTRRVDEGIYNQLYQASEEYGVPVHRGTPESSATEVFAEAVYRADGLDTTYEYYLENGVEDVAKKLKGGNCSDQFSEDFFNTFTLLTELPYFYDVRIGDTTPTDVTKRSVYLEMLDFQDHIHSVLRDMLDRIKPYVNNNNPYILALSGFSDSVHTKAQRHEVMNGEQFESMATVAEMFDCRVINKFYRLLSLGMLVKAHEREFESLLYMDIDTQRYRILRGSYEEARGLFESLASEVEEELDYKAIPIKKLVAIQLRCGLIIGDYINNREEEGLATGPS